MKILFFAVVSMLVSYVSAASPTGTAEDADKQGPKILALLADDLGWGDISTHGGIHVPS